MVWAFVAACGGMAVTALWHLDSRRAAESHSCLPCLVCTVAVAHAGAAAAHGGSTAERNRDCRATGCAGGAVGGAGAPEPGGASTGCTPGPGVEAVLGVRRHLCSMCVQAAQIILFLTCYEQTRR